MNSTEAIDAFHELLQEPVVETERFHEVLGHLMESRADMKYVLHMDALLHVAIESNNDMGPYQKGLLQQGKISTVTEMEAYAAYPDNDPRENIPYAELIERVFKNRDTYLDDALQTAENYAQRIATKGENAFY